MAHPGVKKINVDIKFLIFWNGIKKYIFNIVARCVECQQVKVENKHLIGLLQSQEILESKWEAILIVFIVGLTMKLRRNDSIFEVVDTLTKSLHFIPIKNTYQA
jgi:hypothetical protein